MSAADLDRAQQAAPFAAWYRATVERDPGRYHRDANEWCDGRGNLRDEAQIAWLSWCEGHRAAIAAEREAAAKVCPASPDYEKHVQRMIDEGRGTFTDIVRLAEGAFGDGVSRTLAAIRARGAS